MQPILMQAAEFSFAPLRTLSLLIDFPEAPQKWEMSREQEQWNCRCELPPGEYGYRFLVNEALELNDPQANNYQPDTENKLWSYLRIGSDGKRRYNREPYPVTLTGFAVTAVVCEKLPALQKKKFNLHVDKQAAAGFQFSEKRKLYGSLYYDEKHPSWKLHPNAAGATKGGKYYFDPLQEFLESEITKRDANGYGNAKNALEFITGQKAVTEGTILHDPKYANPDFWYDSKTGKANEENIKKHITDPLESGKMLIATHYADDGHISSHSVLITAYDSDKKELTIQDPWKNTVYTKKIPELFNKKFSGDAVTNGNLTDVTYLE